MVEQSRTAELGGAAVDIEKVRHAGRAGLLLSSRGLGARGRAHPRSSDLPKLFPAELSMERTAAEPLRARKSTPFGSPKAQTTPKVTNLIIIN